MPDATNEPKGVGGDQPGADRALADRVLAKLRSFVESLDDQERAVLAALLAPGVAQAYEPEEDVSGFVTLEDGSLQAELAGSAVADWLPSRLPEYLAASVREHGWRIVADG
jgi:hypothetical protein